MKRKLIFIIGFMAISLISCEYKYIDPLEFTPNGPVSFSEQIEPIFQDKCITCHSSNNPILTTGKAYNSLIEGNYVNTSNPESSKLYDKTSTGHPGGSNTLSVEELALILKWIEDGAENN